jgi:hypothetical protein
MYPQELIEVAIGLIFAWLMLSIAVMQVQEIIARITEKRATDMEKAIGVMLQNSADPTLKDQFYNHPLIQSMKGDANGQWDKFVRFILSLIRRDAPNKNPSYIPAGTFATVLFDIVKKAGTDQSPIQKTLKDLKSGIDNLENVNNEDLKTAVDRIYKLGQMAAETDGPVQENLRETLQKQIDLLNAQHPQLPELTKKLAESINPDQLKTLFTSDLLLDGVRNGIKTLGAKTGLGQALGSLMAGAEECATDTDAAIAIGRKNVETWFNNVMERTGGWYKRWAQTLAFFIGLSIAVVFNIDTIHIAQELWRNPAMRQASTTYIQNYVDAKTKTGGELTKDDLNKINVEIQDLHFPVGWSNDEIEKAGNPYDLFPNWLSYLGNMIGIKNVGSQDDILSSALSWLWYRLAPVVLGPWLWLAFFWHLFWLVKLIGWLITAGATTLGAPFWFDILNKLVNIRSAGVNPAEKTPAGQPQAAA